MGGMGAGMGGMGAGMGGMGAGMGGMGAGMAGVGAGIGGLGGGLGGLEGMSIDTSGLADVVAEASAAGLTARDIADAMKSARGRSGGGGEGFGAGMVGAGMAGAGKAEDLAKKEVPKKAEMPKKPVVKPPAKALKPPPKKKSADVSDLATKVVKFKNRKIPWDPLMEKEGTIFRNLHPSVLKVAAESVIHEFSTEIPKAAAELDAVAKSARKVVRPELKAFLDLMLLR
eukprot:Gregarina_sp_Poly_1__189@NODE_1043_length_5264_cov_29_231672_g723_i0_p3_GENE_NODE_1043_length_5264_cov_29_231672_g723_i0NODE_1043_length_5264_cov_29_231672_g723_i0_p3_ORF_typecomplete_len228_score47_82_NODE_1043_length_5264_cov_29_231672_g723_i01684